MKDNIFIAWRGEDRERVAVKLKEKLEREEFACRIGGNINNDGKSLFIGEYVIDQMKNCNQAIIIFPNRTDSNGIEQKIENIIFEYGYTFARYGAQKVHCVMRRGVKVNLPTDIENSFIKELDADDDEVFVNGIINYFKSRQKLTIEEEKFMLINNWHTIQDRMDRQYSSEGTMCSEYELAQYILFYMQAAHMFSDEAKVRDKLKHFYNENRDKISTELQYALYFCIGYLDMITKIKNNSGDGKVYIEVDDGERFVEICEDTEERIIEHINNKFDDLRKSSFFLWLSAFLYETWNYAYMLLGENPYLSEISPVEYFDRANVIADKADEAIQALEAAIANNQNLQKDKNGIIALFKSYIYRNRFVVLRRLGELDKTKQQVDSSIEFLMKAQKARDDMLKQNDSSILDTKLYKNLEMEYYLASCECLKFAKDKFDITKLRRLWNNIGKFMKKLQAEHEESDVYIKKITSLYDELKSEEFKL